MLRHFLSRLYGSSPRSIIDALRRRFGRVVSKPRPTHDDAGRPLAAIPSEEYQLRAARQISGVLQRIDEGADLEQALMGFDGRKWGERVVEYPAFAQWIQEAAVGSSLLDVGCVLNNPLVARRIRDRCTQVWLCNLVFEDPIHIDGPLYYHRSPLSESFPGGERFDLVTCLSTIEHIGYDNSQYGSSDGAIYTEPSIDPLLDSSAKLAELVRPGGKLLISVPFGKRDVTTHPLTMKIASQIFDEAALDAAVKTLQEHGITSSYRVFLATDQGWESVAPSSVNVSYADGVPGAAAVAILSGRRLAESLG